VQRRLDGGSWSLVGEFTEVESGRRVKRPQLEAALAACRKHKAIDIAKRRRSAPSSSRLSFESYSATAIRCAALPPSWISGRCRRRAVVYGIRNSSKGLCRGSIA
jgi:hypothetical protein